MYLIKLGKHTCLWVYFENEIKNKAEKFLYIEQKRAHINLRITN